MKITKNLGSDDLSNYAFLIKNVNKNKLFFKYTNDNSTTLIKYC